MEGQRSSAMIFLIVVVMDGRMSPTTRMSRSLKTSLSPLADDPYIQMAVP